MTFNSISFTEALFARADSDLYRMSLIKSDFSRGEYCRARLATKSRGSFIGVFLDKRGRYIDEIFLSRDYLMCDWVVAKLLSFAERFNAAYVFLGRRDAHESYDALCASAVYIFDRLDIRSYDFLGYYLVTPCDHVNLLPERHEIEETN